MCGAKENSILVITLVDPVKASIQYENEAAEDAKLLYYLHDDTYFMKDITAKHIQDETKKEPLLQSVIQHIYNGIKPVSPELYHFKNIFDELTLSATGLLLRQYRIILPESLQNHAVTKAHSMGHFGCSGLKR